VTYLKSVSQSFFFSAESKVLFFNPVEFRMPVLFVNYIFIYGFISFIKSVYDVDIFIKKDDVEEVSLSASWYAFSFLVCLYTCPEIHMKWICFPFSIALRFSSRISFGSSVGLSVFCMVLRLLSASHLLYYEICL